MQKIFDEVSSLDKKCYDKFSLSEDLLMEHAALALKCEVNNKIKSYNSTILIVCGVGNNGADGLALARLLQDEYLNIIVYTPFEVKSKMAKLQLERLKLLGVNTTNSLRKVFDIDCVVDSLFGSGLNKPLKKEAIDILEKINSIEAYKIACDIPSGVDNNGEIKNSAFKADVTVTMGALKTSLLTDGAKEFTGIIKKANLGLSSSCYENQTDMYLLEQKDLKLPFRDNINTHKGNYGHACVVIGCKKGAGVIASSAAFSFGAGLVTAIVHEELQLPYYIMQSHNLPSNVTAIALGMGLGLYDKNELKKILNTNVAKVIDADLFYEKLLLDYLNQEIVLTPHPKEFCSLLKLTKLADIDIDTLQSNRFKYVKLFCKKYPKVTLLLKGANVIISQNNKVYVNCLGTSALSKGGSGDVLSGLIVALLAQGYSFLQSAINASLAHTLAAKNFKSNNYALNPEDLIEGIKNL
ncbi:bifunctional ADP-dependent NAD(P)H-hydrate dehydratase/NAD(P)H-hydrate epimerase [Malaciobacter halophilus]|uniref:Bifunctional NAD(P)H-hydrate repair enzyme n=1 Tax=Malaciobacter halophilus TaxID=197482 RepID=A0A2N1J1P1_9BACT|nr:NAD(P)H-hydrate dehydratase [Malaciobacter halophilus]AXH08634.1 carbohydrate kinase, YjeF-related protein [Malaciobacter halophilus]PKI80479.1 bifunctional ADP-dependent NAD(P)H-hydrate dehydratase/NAD(P)H-hydrate epimerase [Malaciobacter halophilus]